MKKDRDNENTPELQKLHLLPSETVKLGPARPLAMLPLEHQRFILGLMQRGEIRVVIRGDELFVPWSELVHYSAPGSDGDDWELRPEDKGTTTPDDL